jgi:hypothetical protein
MKTLLTLSLLLASATSAFAFSTEQVVKVMSHKNVIAAIGDQNIKSIAPGPSFRCMGCYAMLIQTYGEHGINTYSAQVMDFGGRFNVNVGKMDSEKNSAE